MASFIERFNANSTGIKKHSDLNIDSKFLIIEVERKDTKHGFSFLLTLKDVDSSETFKLFLSKKYEQAFTDEDISSINQKIKSFTIQYKGIKTQGIFQIPQFDVYEIN